MRVSPDTGSSSSSTGSVTNSLNSLTKSKKRKRDDEDTEDEFPDRKALSPIPRLLKHSPHDDTTNTSLAEGSSKAIPTEEPNEKDILRYCDRRSTTGPFIVRNSAQKLKYVHNDVTSIKDLFHRRLSVNYRVWPHNVWTAMQTFRKFTVDNQTIMVGDCIFVANDQAMVTSTLQVVDQWKALVIEVRAIDTLHVYVLVAWLNRPEDFAGGRKEYHSRSELIPTNQLDVIDGSAVNGKIELVQWSEDHDDVPKEQQYIWRQTYDAAYTRKLSRLPDLCIEKAPHNPDLLLVQCDSCDQWMHARCIARVAARQASILSKHGGNADEVDEDQTVDQPVDADSAAVSKAECDGYTAEVFIKGAKKVLHEADDEEFPLEDIVPVRQSRMLISGPSGLPHPQAVHCLLCSVVMA